MFEPSLTVGLVPRIASRVVATHNKKVIDRPRVFCYILPLTFHPLKTAIRP
jgi:hypothetical protein